MNSLFEIFAKREQEPRSQERIFFLNSERFLLDYAWAGIKKDKKQHGVWGQAIDNISRKKARDYKVQCIHGKIEPPLPLEQEDFAAVVRLKNFLLEGFSSICEVEGKVIC